MTLTKKQWEAAELKAIREEYPEASLADCRDCLALRGDEWFKACFTAAAGGTILTRKVLDSMTAGQRTRIFHDVPDFLQKYYATFGRDYIEPTARKNKSWKIS